MVRIAHTGYFLPNVKIKYYTVMIDARNFFDQSVQNGLKTFDNIQEITTDYLLNYPYFKKYCKMIAIDLSKQRALDTDPKAYSNNLILLKI